MFRIIGRIIPVIGVAIFFIIGWQVTYSPLRYSIDRVESSGRKIINYVSGTAGVDIPEGYITKNQEKTNVLHYDLDIDLYPEDRLLKGRAIITGIFTDASPDTIDLNFYDNMKITYLSLNDREVPFFQNKTRLGIPDNFLSASDTFRIKVVYEGTPKRLGLSSFVFGKINNRSVVYNLSEPVYASTWIPCNDIPYDKALLDIRITNDAKMTSVSNGKLERITSSEGRKTYHWKTIYPISTYLIAVYSSEYVKFTDQYISADKQDTMSVEYYVFPEHLDYARKDFEDHPRMLEVFSELFGEYPFIKEKYGVAEFLWQLGAMEHQTITGIGSNFVRGNKFFNDVYAHELAHHWWGNAIGPKSWKDIWLNEGFSTYSEALYFEKISGKEALTSTMRSKFSESFYERLYNPGNNIFDPTIYDKGAWVLHMLRHQTGDEVFFEILRVYFQRYKYLAASTSDFKTVAEEISGQDLTKFFDQWLYSGTRHIRAEYDWRATNDVEEKWKISFSVSQIQEEYPDYHFPLDVLIHYDDGSSEMKLLEVRERQTEFTFGADKKPVRITPDPDFRLLAVFKKLR